jgi:hypothetical protein
MRFARISKGRRFLPRLTLRCRPSPDGEEETLSEYICDWPDCPNVAEHMLGAIAELRAVVIVCAEHARQVNPGANLTRNDPRTKDRQI